MGYCSVEISFVPVISVMDIWLVLRASYNCHGHMAGPLCQLQVSWTYGWSFVPVTSVMDIWLVLRASCVCVCVCVCVCECVCVYVCVCVYMYVCHFLSMRLSLSLKEIKWRIRGNRSPPC